MTTPEQRALALARDAKGEKDEEKFERELKLEIAKRNRQLRSNARATSRAMEGWPMARSQEEWLDTVDKAEADFLRGDFLINRLGAERHVDPIMTAVILVLRTQLINEHEATTAAELMIIE